ncbi:MAG: hypothetical protein LBV80_09960 [Deltaproteobacteria bacterium]|jgi:hypothetical protein|nr:hypothetical protein [Deltaproteobacteria bacterium]
MRNFSLFALLCVSLLSTACSSKRLDYYGVQAEGEKAIAIEGPRAEWAHTLQLYLRNAGIKVKRFASQQQRMVREGDGSTVIFDEAATRYILYVDGYDLPGRRCFGGGYTMGSITAELIDTANNEAIFTYTGSGYTEGCEPMSGSTFTDIANAVNGAWK